MESSNRNSNQNNDLQLNESIEEISIKVKTIDSNEYLVNTNKDSSVSDLKQKIEQISKVPVERQRLIFRGKQLKDNDSINTYKISNLDVIHLVAKTTIENQIENTTETEPSSTRDRGVSRSISSLLNLGRSTGRGILDTLNFGELPMEVTNTSRRRRNQREDNSEYNSIECREAIKQNFSSLQNMRECKNTNIDLDSLSEKNEDESKIESFQFQKRKLIVGQWVDVKDTIDQWLEAQVIDIKDNRVYIHYNGWGTRWDEWIDMESDRIMPFRYHTKQTTFSNYNSPFPNVKPDANVNVYNQNDASQQQHQFYDFFNDLSSSYEYCRDIFDKINENRRFIRSHKGFGINSSVNEFEKINRINSNNNFNINSGNRINFMNQNVIRDKNIDNNFIEVEKNQRFDKSSNNNNLIIIPDIKEECKIHEDENSNNVGISNTENTDYERLKRIKQREIFLLSKQLSPLLDRLGRVMTDMGLYMYHNMKNNKLEDLDKELFSNENIDEILRKRENSNTSTNLNVNSNHRSANLNNMIMDTLLTSQPNISNSAGNQNTVINNSFNNPLSRISNSLIDNNNSNNNSVNDSIMENSNNVNTANEEDANSNPIQENKNAEENPASTQNQSANSANNSIHRPNISTRSTNSRTNHSHNHNPFTSGSSRRNNNSAQAACKFEKMLTNQIPCIDTPLVISGNRQSHAQPLVDVYVHTIITPLSETRQTRDSLSTRDPFHLFRNPNENSQENNTNNNNNEINTNLNTNNNVTEASRSLGFDLDNIFANTNANRNNNLTNNSNIETQNAANFSNEDRHTVSESLSQRPSFFGLFPDNNFMDNNNESNSKSNNIQNSEINNINTEEKREDKVEKEVKNNINTTNNINPPQMHNRHLLRNQSSPPFLNLNENSESDNQFLGKKRENDSNAINSENSDHNNINVNHTSGNRNSIINTNNNFNRNDSSNADHSYSPILAPEIEMIIEEYTEQDEDEVDDESGSLIESCNLSESRNDNARNNNNNDHRSSNNRD